MRPPGSTRTDTRFPDTTLFRSASGSFQHPTQRPPYYPFCPYLRYRTTATMLFPATVGQPVCGGDRRERVMSIELTVLAWGCVLGVVQTYVAAELEGRQYGMKWALSSRDRKSTRLNSSH